MKCKSLSLHNKNCPGYCISGTTIQSVNQETDLGVVVQSDLGSSAQCRLVVKRAETNLGLLRRALGVFDASIVRNLVTTYIRPHVEYAVEVWDPWLKKDINLLETPQRRATKMVLGLRNQPYETRLRSLNIHSARYRRLRGSLIFVWVLFNQPNHPCRSIVQLSHNTHTRGHPLKLVQQHSNLNCRMYCFSVRIAMLWNALPEHVVTSVTKDAFKKSLDEYMADSVFLWR